jgi:hypothetical protein
MAHPAARDQRRALKWISAVTMLYDGGMSASVLHSSGTAAASRRRRAAMRLQEIEGNPLDRADIAMFEMFEREGWTDEQRRAFILDQARKASAAA